MAISHELFHVKNRDIFTKFLALLVMALHWYNPLAYFLYYEVCRVSEYACDEAAMQGMMEEEKEKYEFLIVELAEKSSQTKAIFANALSGNYERMKERITLMNRSIIISPKGIRIVSFSLAVLLFVMSPIPVLAYSPMIKSEAKVVGSNLDFRGEICVIYDQEKNYGFSVEDLFMELGTGYDIFVSSEGTLRVLNESSQEERLICIHNWQTGRVQQHINNNDGSCTVNIYEAQTCSKCNVIMLGNLYTSMQYPKCPH